MVLEFPFPSQTHAPAGSYLKTSLALPDGTGGRGNEPPRALSGTEFAGMYSHKPSCAPHIAHESRHPLTGALLSEAAVALAAAPWLWDKTPAVQPHTASNRAR